MMIGDLLTQAACLAVALYFFGPLKDDNELAMYTAIVNKRVQDYRNSLH